LDDPRTPLPRQVDSAIGAARIHDNPLIRKRDGLEASLQAMDFVVGDQDDG